MSEEGDKECLPLLEQFVFSNKIGVFRNIKSVFEKLLPWLIKRFEKNTFTKIISKRSQQFKTRSGPLRHMILLYTHV